MIDTAVVKERRHATRVLLTLTCAALLITYVETMVIPGVPTIQKDFATTASVTSWITSALLIVGAVVSPLFGKLGDTYGKKRILLASIVFYIAGVGIAGFAPTIYFLILARAVQGVGFAMVPLALAIIADVFPKERVATAQGIISATFAIGASAGLIIGSYIVQDLGWQWAFHTAFLLSIIMFVAVMTVLEKDTPRQKAKLDYGGAAILMGGVTLVLLYLTEGPSLGWLSYENVALLILGLALTVFFFYYESRRTAPMIRLGLLRILNVFISNIVGILSGITMFLLFFAVVYYTELPVPFGLGLGIVAAGLVLAPATITMLLAGPLIGRMTTRSGPKPVLFFGALVSMLGLVLFIVNRGTTNDLTLDAAVSLVGLVSLIIPIVNMISVSLPSKNVAVGLGMNTMLRNVGGAIGPVLATTIMTTYTVKNISYSIPSSYAFNLIFIIGIVLMLAIAVMSLFVRNYTFRNTSASQ
jgi:EmrB/QacA subfamily drug resistance transporter